MKGLSIQVLHDTNVMPCCGHRQAMTLYPFVTIDLWCNGCGRAITINWDKPEAPPLRMIEGRARDKADGRQTTLWEALT